jgi:hypothetical protein
MLRTWIDDAGSATEINVFDLLRKLQAGEAQRFLLWTEHAAYGTDESISFLRLAGSSMPEELIQACVVACHAPSREWLTAVSELGIDRLYHGSPHFGHFPKPKDCLSVGKVRDELCLYFTPPEQGAYDVPVCGAVHGRMFLNEWWMRNRCFGQQAECPRYQDALEREAGNRQVNHG